MQIEGAPCIAPENRENIVSPASISCQKRCREKSSLPSAKNVVPPSPISCQECSREKRSLPSAKQYIFSSHRFHYSFPFICCPIAQFKFAVCKAGVDNFCQTARRLEDILEATCFYEEDSVLFLQHG